MIEINLYINKRKSNYDYFLKKIEMKSRLFFIVLSIFFLLTQCAEKKSLLILENVTIIDGTGNLPQPSSDIFIEGGKIIRICKTGKFEYQEDAEVLTLNNKYVIPGLIEMHAHMYGPRYYEEVNKTLLAFGITTVRNPGASAEEIVAFRKRLVSGEITGPRIFTAGWLIDGPESPFDYIKVKTEEEIREAVRRQAKVGVDYIKLYTSLTPSLVKAAIDEAHALGLEVIGHLGYTSWTFAANVGIDALLHSAMAAPLWELMPVEKRDRFYDLANPTRNFNPDLFKEWGESFDIDGPEMEKLTKALVDNNVVVDPTLVMMEAMIWGNDSSYKEILEPDFAPNDFTDEWRNNKLHPYTSWWSDEAFYEAQKLFSVFSEIVKRFYENGVLITAGTDVGNPWITPGVSLHREFELLVKAGIPPLEVLKIATYNGAKALHILGETGTVEVGKQADLVILDSNPIDNIKNSRNIEYVLNKGEIYKPSELLSK